MVSADKPYMAFAQNLVLSIIPIINWSKQTMYTLTKEDIKTIQSADTICFDRYDGKDTMRAIYDEKKNAKGWVKPSAQYEFEVDARFTSYIDAPYEWKPSRCYAHLPVYRNLSFHDTTATFIDFLKAGDSITLAWTTSVGNGYLEHARSTIEGNCHDAPLYHDTLHATITRGNKKYTFLLESSVCVNNSAKMIKG